ncbi:hypothetical protein K4K61_007336 [Colletotrichum sp. SAR11_59]|nr:hypothetical protein K4K61_007336 [Colletotrichum sp. SAR11_59]
MAQDTQLPSYQDAVSRLDWLELVAPYVEYEHFSRLCSVSRHFYAIFAPRLWNDPLLAVRRLGLDPSDDLDWYLAFAFDRVQHIRQSTLSLITTLDFRVFAKDTAHFHNTNRTIPETLRLLPGVLPNLRCILLDGHTEADPATLNAAPNSGAKPPLLVLSMAHCEAQLPSAFFTSNVLQHLVYLDVSGLPGSLQPLLAAAHGRRHLCHLKVLKARRREINDGLALQLFQAFKSRLWSLDLSENNITDAVIDEFVALCFNSPSLRSQSRFMAEGKLSSDGHGNDSHGRFVSIHESDWSATFKHPERHFVDAPVYSADATRDLQEDEAVRSNGSAPLRRDIADHVKAALAGKDSAGFSTSDDLDAGDLLDGGEGFSFFSDELHQPRPQNATKKQAAVFEATAMHLVDPATGRLAFFPFSDYEGEYMDFHDTWRGQTFQRKVWIGPGVPAAAAVNEYMKLVQHSVLRTRVGPATPDHIKAGVPPGALLFHAAWDAIVMPPELKPPKPAELHGMRDVLEAIKKFRLESRAEYEAAKKAAVEGMAEVRRPLQHSFWSGKLEVSVQQSVAHYRAPNYWR